MSGNKRSIRDWAADDRPREKIISKNPYSLSDAELLAILLRSGARDRSAIELAREVLRLGKNNLLELGKISVPELLKINGIGTAKAATIAAALELGRRRHASLPLQRIKVENSGSVALYLKTLLQDYHYEVFGVLYLNRAGKILHWGVVSQGGITGTIVDPRLIFKKAFEEKAVSIILCHNHPSGSFQPSRADEDLTAKINEGAKYFDIKLLDHIIVSDGGHFSFADAGKL